MKFFCIQTKKCENCKTMILKKDYHFCPNCGYPTLKILKTIENSSEFEKNVLRKNSTALHYRIKNNGIIQVLTEMGYITQVQANDFLSKSEKCKNCFDDMLLYS